MSDHYKRIFSGFLLAMIDINLGSFDILPDIIGYLLVFSGLRELYDITEEGAFSFARLLALWMTLSAAFDVMVVTFKLIQLSVFPSYAVMLLGGLGDLLLVVSIYQGMTKHMAILDETALSNRFGNENKRYAVIQGLSLLVMTFSLNMPKTNSWIYMIIPLAISVIMHIRFLINLNTAKSLFEKEV